MVCSSQIAKMWVPDWETNPQLAASSVVLPNMLVPKRLTHISSHIYLYIYIVVVGTCWWKNPGKTKIQYCPKVCQDTKKHVAITTLYKLLIAKSKCKDATLLPSLKQTFSPLKIDGWRLVSFWNALFSGAFAVSFRGNIMEHHDLPAPNQQGQDGDL